MRRARKGRFTLAVGAVMAVSFSFMSLQMLQQHRERSFESRHPLSINDDGKRRRRMRQVSEEVRYVTFGSSSTWGAGLDRLEHAYSYRISSTSSSRNVAMKEGGGVLPAACTQSIVGEEIYDVVTIEFEEFDESYEILAQRLRKRFPEARIIFVQVWNPSQMTYTFANQTSVNLQTWRRDHGNLLLHSSELPMSILESGPEEWSIVRQQPEERRLRDTMERVGAGLVALPTPTTTDFSFPQNLHSFLTFFNEDEPHRLSEEGHQVIAEGIERLLNVQEILDMDQGIRDTTGSWGSGDRCNLWYYNGQYEEESTGYRLGFSHSQTSGEHKHALEFRRNAEGTLKVTNPFPVDRLLYLTYMTASDEEDNKIYPRTRIRLNGRPSVVVDPYHDDGEEVNHHLTRTSVVGMISPGETIVTLDPLEQSSLHFRLVGASILGEEAAKVLPIDFTLEPEPARDETSFWRQLGQF